MTEACLHFYRFDAKLLHFLGFHSQLSLLVGNFHKYAEEILIEFKNKEAEKLFSRSYLFLIDTPPETRLELEELLDAMAFSSIVDNFLTYIAELLSLIFRTKPEALRSGQMMEVKDILQYQTMTELVDAIADRRVNQLAYRGLKELHEEASRTLGFPLFENAKDLRRAVVIVEVRNLIVHKRSVVDSHFVSKLGCSDLGVGEVIQVDAELTDAARRFLGRAVTQIDQRAAEKFGLPRPITRGACGL